MGECDAVDEIVEASKFLTGFLEYRLDFLFGGDVALEQEGAFHVLCQPFGPAAEALVLVDDAQPDARLVEGLADGPGDATLVGDTEDQGLLV